MHSSGVEKLTGTLSTIKGLIKSWKCFRKLQVWNVPVFGALLNLLTRAKISLTLKHSLCNIVISGFCLHLLSRRRKQKALVTKTNRNALVKFAQTYPADMSGIYCKIHSDISDEKQALHLPVMTPGVVKVHWCSARHQTSWRSRSKAKIQKRLLSQACDKSSWNEQVIQKYSGCNFHVLGLVVSWNYNLSWT